MDLSWRALGIQDANPLGPHVSWCLMSSYHRSTSPDKELRVTKRSETQNFQETFCFYPLFNSISRTYIQGNPDMRLSTSSQSTLSPSEPPILLTNTQDTLVNWKPYNTSHFLPRFRMFNVPWFLSVKFKRQNRMWKTGR